MYLQCSALQQDNRTVANDKNVTYTKQVHNSGTLANVVTNKHCVPFKEHDRLKKARNVVTDFHLEVKNRFQDLNMSEESNDTVIQYTETVRDSKCMRVRKNRTKTFQDSNDNIEDVSVLNANIPDKGPLVKNSVLSMSKKVAKITLARHSASNRVFCQQKKKIIGFIPLSPMPEKNH